uniref:Integrase, catalytic region, zinc finger, CCHC-type, peptidase aspartic, catalytic n=1 Tax=Tanacetum cinerariifolium TaxID=118510 RepID=A0A699HRS9_TANCI|nr:integrase, catalytic region, zinc finger, CCHC-type, peptidase aspartic, catalytic [Tanacetum cinerariifolium]
MFKILKPICFGNLRSLPHEKLQPEWQRVVTLVKQSQELKTVSCHKLYDIMKKHQNEVNEIRAERLAHTANPLALVAQQQPVYHPQNHPNHYTQNFSTRSQQPATRNKGKAIVNSHLPTYDQEPTMVAEDDKMSKEKEIDKLMLLISLSFKKICKPTNNNLRTSSNTSGAHQDNTSRINRRTRDDTDDEPEDQELEAYYLYMAQIQEVTLDASDSSRPIFNAEPLLTVQNDNDNYNVCANVREHPKQSESVNDIYLEEQGNTNITIDSIDMSTNGETVDQDDDDLAKERDLLAFLIEKLKCKIDNRKIRNKFLKSLNKTLVDKLKGEIEDFKNTNKSLESSNTHFKEANNELKKTNQLMFKDLKKFQAKLDRYHDVTYALKVEIDYAKAKGYKWKSKTSTMNVKPDLVEIILFIFYSGCSKHMTGNIKLLSNFVEKFIGTVKFGNDQIAPILGYGDLVQGNVTIKRVYYVEGLNHNIFSVGQFYDADIKVAFWKTTCYIRDLKRNDLLIWSHGIDLYSITLQDSFIPNSIA